MLSETGPLPTGVAQKEGCGALQRRDTKDQPMKGKWWLIAGVFSAAVIVSGASPSIAEVYVAGQVGGNFPNDLSNVSGNTAGLGFTFSDLKLQNSLVYGAKAGWYYSRFFGLETEVYNATPHLQQQTATFSVDGLSGPTTFTGNDVRVTTWAFNALVRYPGERLQPYAGVGFGVFFAHVNNFFSNGGGASDTNVGFTALAGIRYFLTENLALFGEWKYNRVNLSFGGVDSVLGNSNLSGTYSTDMVVGGVSWHFR